MAADDVRPLRAVAAPGRIRTAWVDVARGIGIILVVYGHALRGLVNAGWLTGDTWAAAHDRAIYAFHMPLFFLLAGLFLEHGIAKGTRPFLADKLATIVYPYFLWSAINASLQIALPDEVNIHVTPGSLLSMLWAPLDQFWFLYALFLCQIIALACLPRLPLLLLATAAGLACFRWAGYLGIASMALYELPFVVTGVMLARGGLTRTAVRPATIATLLIVGWAIYLFLLVRSPGDDLATQYALALAGGAGTIGLAMIAGRRAGWLAALGRASMPIYVAHVIVTAGLRIGAQHWWRSLDPIVLLAASTILGLAVPFALYRLAEKAGVSVLLGFRRATDRSRVAA